MRFAEIFKTELFSKYGQKAGCYINEIYDITAQNQNAIDSIVEKSEKLSDVSDTIQHQVTQNQTIAKRISDIVNKFTIN